MTNRQAALIRAVIREIEGGSYTDTGVILSLRHAIDMSPKRKPVPKKRSKPRRVSVNRDIAYRHWVTENRCVVMERGALSWCDHWKQNGRADAAHTAHNNGLSSKGPDSSCVALCRHHHREYDNGRAAFENKYGIDMKAEAAKSYARYQRENGKAAA